MGKILIMKRSMKQIFYLKVLSILVSFSLIKLFKHFEPPKRRIDCIKGEQSTQNLHLFITYKKATPDFRR